MKVNDVFGYELSMINDSKIKDFVVDVFDKFCPDYFWTCPCSTSGKYHPQVSLGVGGLVRHTKLAVWWGLELIRALHDSSELKGIALHTLQDEIIATLLLHDLIKNGKGLDSDGRPLEKGVTGTHGVTLLKKINNEILDYGGNSHYEDNDSFDRILIGIGGHMGIWTTDKWYRPSSKEDLVHKAFAQLIHLADYCASRKVDDIYATLQSEKQE